MKFVKYSLLKNINLKKNFSRKIIFFKKIYFATLILLQKKIYYNNVPNFFFSSIKILFFNLYCRIISYKNQIIHFKY